MSYPSNTPLASRGSDPLDLKVIYRPARDRAVDIIFVHGLGGSSRLTWSKNYRLEFCWPLKFLPHEPDISEARILTFGYNANFRPGSGKNKTSILDFAKDLLYELKYAKDELGPELEDLRMGEASIIASTCVLGRTNMNIAAHYLRSPLNGRAHCERGTVLKLLTTTKPALTNRIHV